MDEGRTRTLVLDDSRGDERFLRVTWHPSSSTLVFSHWNGPVCTASTPVTLPEASKIIALVVSALRDVAETSAVRLSEATSAQPGGRIDRLLRRVRPHLATIARLPE